VRRVSKFLITLFTLLLASTLCSFPAASAAGEPKQEKFGFSLGDSGNGGKKPKRPNRSGKAKSPGADYKQRVARSMAEWKAYRASLTKYEARMQAWTTCVQATDHNETCVAPAAPTAPGAPPDGYINGILVPILSDEEAAYIAFARLRLTPPTPIVGPSPNLNEWKMAAVGYPLWLSVGGDPTPPAVADAVADVHVRLEAHVSKVVFSMGDRHAVTCTNVTTRWSESVRGKNSPVCGYRYQKPSLPKRSYTVTATTHWSVAWSTSRDRGVIPFIQSSSSQLPVGELQVIVR